MISLIFPVLNEHLYTKKILGLPSLWSTAKFCAIWDSCDILFSSYDRKTKFRWNILQSAYTILEKSPWNAEHTCWVLRVCIDIKCLLLIQELVRMRFFLPHPPSINVGTLWQAAGATGLGQHCTGGAGVTIFH